MIFGMICDTHISIWLRDCKLDFVVVVVVVLIAKRADAGTKMGSVDTNLPPGFRFHPTDEELVRFFLMHKIMKSNHSWVRVIPEVDLQRCEPWDLPGVGKKGEKDQYYFTVRDRKYPTGTRSSRGTEAGFWKATGKDRCIFDSRSSRQLIGMKKILVFYTGRAPRGQKTNWIMHEYRLEGDAHLATPTKDSEWVICRVFQKVSGQQNFGLLPSASISLGKQPSIRQLFNFSKTTCSTDIHSTAGEDDVKDSSNPFATDIKPLQVESPWFLPRQNPPAGLSTFQTDSTRDNMSLLAFPSDTDQFYSNPVFDQISNLPQHLRYSMTDANSKLPINQSSFVTVGCQDSFIPNITDTRTRNANLDVISDTLGLGENIDRLIDETAGGESRKAGDLRLYKKPCTPLYRSTPSDQGSLWTS
ncbi:hypothetical protein O6H91_01G166300 [Diphasiastrum complanatum]|uniref:Uncharacterized protein n=1 Tax=Diphasiastrum complanatum TaxID=34168 RepID=A0ACC2EYJ2_DIPCM|nr:hypothetical protein O6H91_01G166300 [Diphasiastrum complanatum]